MSQLAAFADIFGVESFCPAFIRIYVVTALSRLREQCTFTWRPWILKCLEATRNWYHVSPIWQVFSTGEEIVNWFDLRWRQHSATTVEHETEWSCYSLPIFLVCRALHHPYPRAFCTLPSFARIKRPRWRPVGLNDRHLRSNGKIGDCEQSILPQAQLINKSLKSWSLCLFPSWFFSKETIPTQNQGNRRTSSLGLFNRSHTHQSHTNEANNMKQYQATRERPWRKICGKSKVLGNDTLP